MAAGAPRDPQFYIDLDAMAQRVGAQAEDLLLVWTSESGLDAALSGGSRTFSTLMHYIAVPKVMDEATWQKLPSMTHVEQLPWVEKGIYAPAHSILGRNFKSTFEVYLANAAPGLLRGDGRYSDASPMYVGDNYIDNWTMDNAPAGAQTAIAEGVRITSPRATYAYGQSLVERGILKGYVSLGDLRNFARRILSGGGVFDTAKSYLSNVRKNVAAGLQPSVDPVPPDFLLWVPAAYHEDGGGYSPDFDSQFDPSAPPDTRIASPSAAKKKTPKSANGHAAIATTKNSLIATAIVVISALLIWKETKR